jgi:hypothetical protein
MNANELRIGNRVRSLIGDEIVHEIYTHKVLVGGMDSASTVRYDEIMPIPLNDAWLLKLGFYVKSLWTWSMDIDSSRKLVYYVGIRGWFINTESNGIYYNVQHVHQIQNLYHALTGKELEIMEL